MVPLATDRDAGGEKLVPSASDPRALAVVSCAALLRLKTIVEADALNAATKPSADTWLPAGEASCGEYGVPEAEGSKEVRLGEPLSSLGENRVPPVAAVPAAPPDPRDVGEAWAVPPG